MLKDSVRVPLQKWAEATGHHGSALREELEEEGHLEVFGR